MGLIDLPLRASNEGWLIRSISFAWLAGMETQSDEPERPDKRAALLKEQRDRAVLCDLGDERFRVVLQKPGNARKCLDEDLSHFFALEIA